MSFKEKLKDRLFEQVDVSSLAVFRIIFGVLMAWQSFVIFSPNKIYNYYILPNFHFTYPFLSFLKPWPGDGMYIHVILMGACALLIALGLFYRIATTSFFLLFTYIFLLDKSYYNNHYYLISLISFILIFSDAHRTWALDCHRNHRIARNHAPCWQVFLLKAQIIIVYFYGGLAKLNSDWLSGEVMRITLHGQRGLPLFGPHVEKDWLVYLFTYGGLTIDLSVGFLLLFKKTRWFSFGVILLFNLINHFLFGEIIGIFPFLMVGVLILFFDPETPRMIYEKIRKKMAKASIKKSNKESVISEKNKSLIFWCVILFLSIQLLVPLRHWLYPGDVNWTAEGDRFAWRMRLNHYQAFVSIKVEDSDTGREFSVDRLEGLNVAQGNVYASIPDMIYQYAHFLRDKYKKQGIRNPIVRMEIDLSFNNSPPHDFINPETNLAAVNYSAFSHAQWVVPRPTD